MQTRGAWHCDPARVVPCAPAHTNYGLDAMPYLTPKSKGHEELVSAGMSPISSAKTLSPTSPMTAKLFCNAKARPARGFERQSETAVQLLTERERRSLSPSGRKLSSLQKGNGKGPVRRTKSRSVSPSARVAVNGALQSRALANEGVCPWMQAQLALVSQAFVPEKTCERYLLEDCAAMLHNCAAWLPMLVMESRKLAHAIIERGKNQGLAHEHTLALVVYTADLRQFGASEEHNLYHVINTVLLNAEDTATRGQIQEQIRGYLHFFSNALALLPREQKGWTYRGIMRAAFDSSDIQYRQGAVVRWQGIVSTSKDKHVAINFSGGKASSGWSNCWARVRGNADAHPGR